MQKNLAVLITLLLWSNFSNASNETARVLSRKRRYLLFPEGSSLQLVYDFTVPISYSTTIFVFSTTAALAWMLPSTIEEFQHGFLSKKFYKVPSNRMDTQKTKFTKLKPINNDEFWHNKPYEKYTNKVNERYKPYVDYGNQFVRYRPDFNKLSSSDNYRPVIQKSPSYSQSMRRKYYNFNRKNINNVYRDRNYHKPVTTYVDPVYYHYHRRTGRDLFKKIEKFLTAQKKDGKTCVLKAICEVNERSADKKGTFTEEILKAIFRFHPSGEGEGDIYDKAASELSCSELYPCDFSIWDVI